MSSMESLTDILHSLGISEYFGGFIAAGFFTWDDLIDITEAEVQGISKSILQQRLIHMLASESLNVKRGCRRESSLSIPIKDHFANARYRSFNEE